MELVIKGDTRRGLGFEYRVPIAIYYQISIDAQALEINF